MTTSLHGLYGDVCGHIGWIRGRWTCWICANSGTSIFVGDADDKRLICCDMMLLVRENSLVSVKFRIWFHMKWHYPSSFTVWGVSNNNANIISFFCSFFFLFAVLFSCFLIISIISSSSNLAKPMSSTSLIHLPSTSHHLYSLLSKIALKLWLKVVFALLHSFVLFLNYYCSGK